MGAPVFAQMVASEPFDPRTGAARYWLVKQSQSGGGPMADFGCHRLEVLLHLLGPIARVRSVVANVALEREVEDTAVALLQFERGACAMVALTHAAAERQGTLSIPGSPGSIHLPSLHPPPLLLPIAAQAPAAPHPPP